MSLTYCEGKACLNELPHDDSGIDHSSSDEDLSCRLLPCEEHSTSHCTITQRSQSKTEDTQTCTCASSLEFHQIRKSSTPRDGLRFRRSSSCPAGDSPTSDRKASYDFLGGFDSFEDMDFMSLPCAAVLGQAGVKGASVLGQAGVKAGELAHSAFDRSCQLAQKAGKIANKAVVEARTEAGELAHTAGELAHTAAHTAGELAHTAVTKTGQLACKAEQAIEYAASRVWKCVHHHSLPQWMKDNEFLIFGHRPQLNSYKECFSSIFRVHTETGNIWTHLLGFLAFVVMACRYLTFDVEWQEKLVFSSFFAGAILCMGFSWIMHAVYCHSEHVSCVFNKLDYCGIALLTVGSFVPWLYYSFYWRQNLMITYLICIIVLGIITIVVSIHPTFATPKFRSVRASTFVVLGLSATIPVGHYIAAEGWTSAFNVAGLGPLIIMATLYISGAVIYAMRIPEKWWPGKFDIWFQSHQVFHVFVVAAAFVHYHGISVMANNRLMEVKGLY